MVIAIEGETFNTAFGTTAEQDNKISAIQKQLNALNDQVNSNEEVMDNQQKEIKELKEKLKLYLYCGCNITNVSDIDGV